MTIEVFNPPGLMQPTTYRQVSVATGSRMVFLAGQVARDAEGNAVGAGDLAEQRASGGAGPDLGTDMLRPTTLVGVAALFEPDILIEVEAIAVLP